MTIIPGSWAGMIPFFATQHCRNWIYDLPLLTDEASGVEAWTKTTTTGVDHNQTDFPWTHDHYRVVGPGSTEFLINNIQQPDCTGYTATFQLFDIPSSVPAAMLAYLNAYVVTTSPGTYSATATWNLSWAGATVTVSTTCFYYWPLAFVPPDITFGTSWSMNFDNVAGTPSFAYPVSGSAAGSHHPLAGIYTITNARLTYGDVLFEHSTGVGLVNDVIGRVTDTR